MFLERETLSIVKNTVTAWPAIEEKLATGAVEKKQQIELKKSG